MSTPSTLDPRPSTILSPFTGRPLPANSAIARARMAELAKTEVTQHATRNTPVEAAPQAAMVQDISPSLARILRPQAAYRWLLPYLAAITPTYVEGILRGALAGNHVQAWELFDLICDTNPEIGACIGEYVDGIAGKKLIITPYAEEDEQPSDNAVENQKIVSAAFRNLRPDPANDENNLKQTMRDIAFGRFHGQSILETDYYLSDDPETLYEIDVAGVGAITAPRCTFWVHPVCYAWTMEGRLGLRVALQNQIQEITRTAKNQKPGQRGGAIGSMIEAPAWNWITSQPMPSYVQEFPDNKFLISIMKASSGTALKSSCLRQLAWWWVVSNFAGDWLLDLAQIFGIPFRKATYKQGTGEPQKAEAREMLQNMGSRGWCLLDERIIVEFEKAMESGAQSPQGFLVELAEKQFRKVILRQTMTGQHGTLGKGGGQAFGETEQTVKDKCIQAGADHVADVLRDQFARSVLMVNKGEDSELPLISLQEEESGNLQDAQILAALAPLNNKLIGVNYTRKLFSIPKPADDEDTLGSAPPPASQVPNPKLQAPENTQALKDKSAPADADEKEAEAAQLEAGNSALRTPHSAISGAPSASYQCKALEQYAAAFASDITPVLERLAKILEIEDDALFVKKLEAFHAEFPQLKKDVLADPASARALQPIIATALANGLARETKEKKS